MGRRYLSTLLMLFFQRILISDDLLAERLMSNNSYQRSIADLSARMDALEQRVDAIGSEAAAGGHVAELLGGEPRRAV
jgi:hypothetical protein